LVVLDDLVVGRAFLVVEDDADDTEENGLEDLQDDVQGLPELVDPAPHEYGSELGQPGSFLFLVHSFQLMGYCGCGHYFLSGLLEVLHEVVYSLFEFEFDLFIGVVFLLLDVGEHDSFFVHEFHVVIGGVGVFGHGEVDGGEVVDGFGGLAVVDDVAVNHQDYVVEFHEDLGGRLMDGGDDRSSLFGQFVQEAYQV
jgi:hypothetical protein